MVPFFANQIIRYLEISLTQNVQEKYENLFSFYVEKNCKRYLEGLFVLWLVSIERLNESQAFLNGLDVNMQFLMEYRHQHLSFRGMIFKKSK